MFARVILACACAAALLQDVQVAAAPSGGDGDRPWNYEVDIGLPTAEDLQRRSAQAPHFTYFGARGPAKWGELDATYSKCSTGTQQSPINLPDITPNGIASELTFNWVNLVSPVTLTNNGHTFQVSVASNANGPKNYVTFKGKQYFFQQFHFHGPSEHMFEGRAYVLEMHCVHKATDGSLLVVGIFMDQFLPPRQFFNNFVGKIPTTVASNPVDMAVSWTRLLKDIRRSPYWQYAGSLTTPPCSESVQWIVMKNAVGVSDQFIKESAVAYGFNSRFTLPVGDRIPSYDEASEE